MTDGAADHRAGDPIVLWSDHGSDRAAGDGSLRRRSLRAYRKGGRDDDTDNLLGHASLRNGRLLGRDT